MPQVSTSEFLVTNTYKVLVSLISFFVFFIDQALHGMALYEGKNTIP